jgi:hypothetical protein
VTERESGRNEVGERERVQVGLKKEMGASGQATWPWFSACVCAGQRRFTGKAELTGLAHDAAAQVCVQGEQFGADGAGLFDRERIGRTRGKPAPTDRPHPGRGREGARAHEAGLALTGGGHLSGRERARVGLGRMG